jgi:hypothetical protein
MDGSVTLWRHPGPGPSGGSAVDCVMEQLGEGFYELSLRSGGRVLLCEPFEDAGALLRRADELRGERAGVSD